MNEIEKREDQPLAVPNANELAAAFDGDKGLNVPVGAVLPIVKILRESPKFEMPDGNVVESFRGHILYYHSVNQLYLEEYGPDSGGQRPDCSSFDGLVPCNGFFDRYTVSDEIWFKIIERTNGPANLKDIDPSHPLAQFYLNKFARSAPSVGEQYSLVKPGEKIDSEKVEICNSCPAAQFGSKSIGDNSKACTNYIWLYVLIDGYQLPVFMKAGPASLGVKIPGISSIDPTKLISFLSNAPNIGLGGMYQTVSIQFSLTTRAFTSGFSASSLKLSDPKVIDPGNQDDTEKLLMLMAMYKSFKVKYLDGMKKFVTEDRGEENKAADTENEAF